MQIKLSRLQKLLPCLVSYSECKPGLGADSDGLFSGKNVGFGVRLS